MTGIGTTERSSCGIPSRPEFNLQPSQGVVAREIEGEIVIVPVTAGIGEAEDELYTLNETGQASAKAGWTANAERRGGVPGERVHLSADELESDVLGFDSQLAQRGILVAKA